MEDISATTLLSLEKEIRNLRKENERLKKFIDFGRMLSLHKTIDRLLPLVMKEISKYLHADRSTLFLIDWDRKELWAKFAEGLKGKGIKIRLKMGLAGLCAITRQTVNVINAYNDPYFHSSIDQETGFRTESVLSVPILDNDAQVTGVIQLLNKKTGFFSNEDEQTAITAAAILAGLGYEALSDNDNARVFIRDLRLSTSCERGSLFLFDPIKGELSSVVAEGLEDDSIHLDLNLGIAGQVAVTGKEINIQDAYSDPRFDQTFDRITGYHTRSILSVPMKGQSGGTLGVIQVLNKREGPFTDSDVDFLHSLSPVVGMSIENTLLSQEQDQQFKSTLQVFAASIDAKDHLTAGHSQRVTEFCSGIAHELGFKEMEIDILSVAALLHDYGKLGVDDHILKKSGSLTPGEHEQIKRHVVHTRSILSKMRLERRYHQVPFIASCHHERIDGTGYIQGLKGNEIPFMSKIIAVADVFEALTARRHYRDSLSPEASFAMLEEHAGVKYDENIVAALKRYWYRTYSNKAAC
ncbi:MAG: GAF domain-containing protein [Deltaproteobacteria bacterium]|nr:GAF domain-containing protein [Deltaproteobacteria bacterium]